MDVRWMGEIRTLLSESGETTSTNITGILGPPDRFSHVVVRHALISKLDRAKKALRCRLRVCLRGGNTPVR